MSPESISSSPSPLTPTLIIGRLWYPKSFTFISLPKQHPQCLQGSAQVRDGGEKYPNKLSSENILVMLAQWADAGKYPLCSAANTQQHYALPVPKTSKIHGTRRKWGKPQPQGCWASIWLPGVRELELSPPLMSLGGLCCERRPWMGLFSLGVQKQEDEPLSPKPPESS